MNDLPWNHRGKFTFPLYALNTHTVIAGGSGSGKTETIQRIAYGARTAHQLQIVYLDAKGETKRDEEEQEDNAARFVAAMQAAGANTIGVFPSTHYNGWQGTATELKNRLLSVIDFSESAFYGDVAANALDLALSAPTTPRSSSHLLENLHLDRLKNIYKNDRLQYQRVLALDKDLLQQVEMRYQVFFRAMNGQLDGSLNYANLDAAYLRVRGFALRDQAPRLGRFLVMDFIHYISERRKPGVRTLFIIDEFNALRIREEASLLFEMCRSFGGNLIISAQGYAGLGPPEYSERILDACSTFVLHSCSDPHPIAKRAGKQLRFDVVWSESDDEEDYPRRTIRKLWDWKVQDDDVRRQTTGQAFWIYKNQATQAQTARVPITTEQIREAWREIRRQEDVQRQISEVERQRRQRQQTQRQKEQSNNASSTNGTNGTRKQNPKKNATATATSPAKSKAAANTTPEPAPAATPDPRQTSKRSNAQTPRVPPAPPTPDQDDDEPDKLF